MTKRLEKEYHVIVEHDGGNAALRFLFHHEVSPGLRAKGVRLRWNDVGVFPASGADEEKLVGIEAGLQKYTEDRGYTNRVHAVLAAAVGPRGFYDPRKGFQTP